MTRMQGTEGLEVMEESGKAVSEAEERKNMLGDRKWQSFLEAAGRKEYHTET